MKHRRATVCGALALAALNTGAALAGSAAPDSGLRGVVLEGPFCPVQRPGEVCDRPLATAVLVSRAASDRIVVRTRSATDGRFTVRLPAGRYLVRAGTGSSFPHVQSRTVSVTAHRFTAVTLRLDSGIR